MIFYHDISAAEEPVTHIAGYSFHKGVGTILLSLSFFHLMVTLQVTRGTEEERGCRPVTVQFEKYTVVQIMINSSQKNNTQ